MEKLLLKVYQEKMQDGTIEKIVSEEFEKLVKNACDAMFGWRGNIRNELEAKLKDVMSGLIEQTDFSKYVTKMKYIINEALANSAASDYKNVTDSLIAVLGQPHIELFSTIKASEIFNTYCDYIENKEYSEYELIDDVYIDYDDGEKMAYLNCRMYLEDNTLTFECYEIEDNEEYKYEINLTNKNEIRFNPKIELRDFRRLDDFTCYLLMLSNNWVKVELDIKDKENVVEVKISE